MGWLLISIGASYRHFSSDIYADICFSILFLKTYAFELTNSNSLSDKNDVVNKLTRLVYMVCFVLS
jgi:hypothetical protein